MNVNRKSKVNLRECFIAITPNFAAISMAWLNRRAQLREIQGHEDDSANALGQSITTQQVQRVQPVQHRTRRASVASCVNMFEVDGTVTEVGFDYLARVPRENPIIRVQPRGNPQTTRNSMSRAQAAHHVQYKTRKTALFHPVSKVLPVQTMQMMVVHWNHLPLLMETPQTKLSPIFIIQIIPIKAIYTVRRVISVQVKQCTTAKIAKMLTLFRAFQVIPVSILNI